VVDPLLHFLPSVSAMLRWMGKHGFNEFDAKNALEPPRGYSVANTIGLQQASPDWDTVREQMKR
jgi:hypothetical protein